jgi:hypothetical protein
MGILAICLGSFIGVVGIILGILATKNGKRARELLDESYYMYYNALAGMITGYIGLGMSILASVIYTIYFFIICASVLEGGSYYY